VIVIGITITKRRNLWQEKFGNGYVGHSKKFGTG
jgi:hypothetical protein